MKNALNRLIKRTTVQGEQKMFNWQWGQGVVLYALHRVYENTKDESIIEFIKSWVDERLDKELPGRSINTTSPFSTVVELYKITGDEKYKKACDVFAKYLMGENPRCEKGGFEHTCTGNSCPNQMWIDTLFMCGIFLVKYGLLTGEDMYIHEALRQFVVHYDFLSDKETGLVYHGYYSDDRTQRGVLWGRGNGWFSAASAIVIDLLKDREADFPVLAKIKENYLHHCMGALNLQQRNGSWNTVINDNEDSYCEASGTSGMAFGIIRGIEMGLIDEFYEEEMKNSIKFLVDCVDEDGVLTHASTGTCVMDGKDKYNEVPVRFEEFSQGLGILALSVDEKWYK